MSVETATYLSEFNTSFPTGGDFRSEGDNHIRLLKSVLQNTFPNFAGRFNRVLARGTTFSQAASESHAIYNCSGTLTINLITAATAGNGFVFTAINTGAGSVTVDPSGAELVNGAATFSIPAGAAAIVFCDGSAFYAYYLLKNISAFALTLLDDVDAATARATLCAAPLDSPTFTGVPTAPTASAGTATTQIATTAFVANTVGVGQIALFARSTPPGGWLKADGSAVSRATYAGLFSAIGTTWGAGDGSTTFNLPDLRGEFLRCWDDGKGTDAARAFASFQAGALPSIPAGGWTVGTQIPNPGGGITAGTLVVGSGAAESVEVLESLRNAGADRAQDGSTVRPRNFALLACIKI